MAIPWEFNLYEALNQRQLMTRINTISCLDLSIVLFPMSNITWEKTNNSFLILFMLEMMIIKFKVVTIEENEILLQIL